MKRGICENHSLTAKIKKGSPLLFIAKKETALFKAGQLEYNDRMYCPYCEKKDSRVLESRMTGEKAIRRRRECESCHKRFTTYERVEVMQILVVKSSGDREPYSREKLKAGVWRACAKTAVSAEQIDDLVDSVEAEMASLGKREIPARTVGELTLEKLSSLDDVAYVRFASVYRQFKSIEDFVSELGNLKETAK